MFAMAAIVTAAGDAAAGPLPGSPAAPVARERLQPIPVAVFGDDDRTALPPRYRNLRNVIGLLFNRTARTVCTAFCVAPDVIATAAHCLYATQGKAAPFIGGFQFSLYATEDRAPTALAGASTASVHQHVIAGSTMLSTHPPIDATSDWAVIRLARPACRHGHLPINPLSPEAVTAASHGGRVYQVAYHRDVPGWPLLYSRPCIVERDYPAARWGATSREFSRADDLLLHVCDTGGASSGSPLLVDGPAGPEVVGINVGTYVLSRLAIRDGSVVRRLQPQSIANTAVSARAFAWAVEPLRVASVLSTGQPLRVAQAALRSRGHYDGPLDGRFGPGLRQAIRAYELAEGLPVTGLPTTRLLDRIAPAWTRTARTGSLPASATRKP